MDRNRLVSVIMPTYNAGKYLADSISSILDQTYLDLELLITDDGSTDPVTLDILHEIEEKDSRVDVLYLDHNHGAGYARNKSIERAKGRYIAFCDCDDQWTLDKLEKQIAFMNQKQCALSCTSYFIFNFNEQKSVGINIAPPKITFSMMKRDNKIGCLTAIYDTQLLGRKYYMPTLRKRQDWALFLQILKDCKECYSYPNQPLAVYCRHKHSISSSKMSLAKYNIAVYRRILGYGRMKACFYFAFLFLPTYILKLMKRKLDSYCFVKRKG
jgi:teichuronic acid biosynthesis glycosyltransferase TuaG